MPQYDFTALSTGSNAKSAAVNSAQPRGESDQELRDWCVNRWGMLRTERESWRLHWLDLAAHIAPRRGRMLTLPNSGARGRKAGHKIINSTATQAANTLASGMLTGLTSPAHRWFVLAVEDEALNQQTEVRAWLDLVTSRVLSVMASSNVYSALHTLYGDQGVFGQGVMLVDEDLDARGRFNGIRCYSMEPGQFLLANSSRMEPTTLYRDFVLNVGQMVEQFGFDNCSKAVQDLYRSNQLTAEREILHVIEPNPRHTHNALPPAPAGWSRGFAKGWPYRCVYLELGGDSDRLLGQGGYHEQPFVAPRWKSFGNDVYGRSPGMDALADVRTLQSLERAMAEGVGKLVNPPLVAPLSMEHEPISALPGGINFLGPEAYGKIGELYQVKFRPEMLQPLIRDKERLIKEAFFADLFLMISQMEGAQPVTAEEIRARQGEKLLMLGPVVERNQTELINPLIARVIAILTRWKLIPRPPRALQGRGLEVQCVSPLAAAQRATATTSIEQLVAFAGRLASNPTWEPIVSAKISPEKALDAMADALMVPTGVLVDDDDAMEQVQARAQQKQAQQAAQNAMAAVQGAQTLSQTDVGGGQNALSAMLGGSGLGGSGGAPASGPGPGR